MYRRKRRILKSLVLGFAVAASAAPTALAEPRGPGNGDPVIAASSPDDRSLYRGTAPQSVSPDDRPLFRGVETTNVPETIVLSPDDRSFYRGSEPNAPVTVMVSSPSDGFQWDDAGLGAASTLALVLLMGAATLVIRHQRRRLAAF
jgi:hypothetical protein